MIASSQQIPGCSHLGRIRIGHGDHAPSEENGDLTGIDFIVFGFTAMDGFHVEGMTQDKGDAVVFAEISDPVPGEHAFDSDNDVFQVGLDGPKKDISLGFDVPVEKDLSGLIEDTEVHFFGMKVDFAIKLVLFGVESHWASSFGLGCFW
jgi:hypothetical protein